ncbi:hypothetical protein [Alistipes sp.]|uniref:hypothetical protein n=1 Tax=Alistipes sp. TaxID=1872444 RepID=UPI003AEFF5A7
MEKINRTLSSREDRATGKSEVMIRFIAAHQLTLRARTGLFVPPERWSEKTGDVRISMGKVLRITTHRYRRHVVNLQSFLLILLKLTMFVALPK